MDVVGLRGLFWPLLTPQCRMLSILVRLFGIPLGLIKEAGSLLFPTKGAFSPDPLFFSHKSC